jgi:chromosomal replication initiator protein
MAIASALRQALATQVGPERFNLWFGESTELDVRDDRIVVSAPNLFFQEFLRRNFRAHLETAVEQVLGRATALEFVVRDREQDSTCKAAEAPCHDLTATEPAPRPSCQSSERRTAGRRFARLEDFVVGDSNRLAYTTVKLAAKQLGRWSPLVIHGDTGVGKTHLLEGLWSEVRRTQPQIGAVFLTAEQFTSYFLEALRGSGLPNFRRKYRGVDLLLIDDIQFFAGKRATLVELLYTVNTLLEEGRQVVLAADRPPLELDALGKELIQRLSGGMVCHLDPPDYEVRLGIVTQLARGMDMRLAEDVQDFVARSLTGGARELSGAVNLLHITQMASGQSLTLAMAQEALSDMTQRAGRTVLLGDIEAAVCEVFGLEKEMLQSDRRSRDVSYPRMLAMWLARKHTRAALSEIGHYFGRRTHSTVISAQKKVGGWIEKRELLHLGNGRFTAEEAIRRVERVLEAG